MSTDVLPEEEVQGRAPLRVHIAELRNRILRSLVVVVIAVIAAWAFHEQLFDWLMEPYTNSMKAKFPDEKHYIEYRSLTEPLVVYLKTAFTVGALAALPYVIFEIWRFVIPGLYKEERQLTTSFLVATILCFFAGVFFCRYLVLEPAVWVLLGIGATNTNAAIMMNEYFGFTSRLLFVFGLLFELPVVISFLAFMGLVTHTWLLKQWRYAVVLMFVVSAVLTPPDPVSQTLLAVPLVILYFVSVGIAWMFSKRRAAKRLGDEPELEDDAEEDVDP